MILFGAEVVLYKEEQLKRGTGTTKIGVQVKRDKIQIF